MVSHSLLKIFFCFNVDFLLLFWPLLLNVLFFSPLHMWLLNVSMFLASVFELSLYSIIIVMVSSSLWLRIACIYVDNFQIYVFYLDSPMNYWPIFSRVLASTLRYLIGNPNLTHPNSSMTLPWNRSSCSFPHLG